MSTYYIKRNYYRTSVQQYTNTLINRFAFMNVEVTKTDYAVVAGCLAWFQFRFWTTYPFVSWDAHFAAFIGVLFFCFSLFGEDIPRIRDVLPALGKRLRRDAGE